MTSKRTLKLVVEYDGGRYSGWQVQPGVPTIQGEIELRLERLLASFHRIHGAGRTDSGVHALGQVAHFHTESRMPAPEMLRALNALLPRDIGVRTLEEVSSDFHARFDASSKKYTYQILNRPIRSVFLDAYAWHIRHPLDWSLIEMAAQCLVGEHDFGSFRAADCTAQSAIREVRSCRAIDCGEGLHQIQIVGTGFLKHMVRTIVGTLVEVGSARRSVDGFKRLIAARDRKQAGRTAPAKGLRLDWVAYGGEPG